MRCLTGFGFFSTTALALSLVLGNAYASSDAAWRDFRGDVSRACTAAARQAEFRVQTIAVDPFGSSHYGLARLTGHERGSDKNMPEQLLCAYDKQQRTAEVGTPMPARATKQMDKTQR